MNERIIISKFIADMAHTRREGVRVSLCDGCETCQLQREEQVNNIVTEFITAIGNPTVIWILKHVYNDYPFQCINILRHWPMAGSDLDEMAIQEDWCNEYNKYRTMMIMEGVWPTG